MDTQQSVTITRMRAALAQPDYREQVVVKFWHVDTSEHARLAALKIERPDIYARLVGLCVFDEREREVVSEDRWLAEQARVGFVRVALRFGAAVEGLAPAYYNDRELAHVYASALARVDELFAALDELPDPVPDTEHPIIRAIELCCYQYDCVYEAGERFDHGVRNRDERACEWAREASNRHSTLMHMYRDRVRAALADHPDVMKWAVSHGRLLYSKRRTPEKIERSAKRGRKLLARLPEVVS